MVFHMKTTLNLDDTTMVRLKQEAALRLLLREGKPKKKLPRLPTFRNRGPFVEIAEREPPYQVMEGR